MSHMNPRPGEPSGSDDYALDRNGKPIVDRFGRPVPRRSPLSKVEDLPKPKEQPRPPKYRRSSPSRDVPRDIPRTNSPRRESGRHRPPHTEVPRAAPLPPSNVGSHRSSLRDDARDYPRDYAQQPHSYEQPRPEAGYEIPSRRQERMARIGSQAWEGRRRKEKEPFPRIGGRGPASRSPRRRRNFSVFKTLGALLLVLVVLLVGTGIWIDTSLNRTDALQKYDGRVGNTAGTNWLLVGSDSRAGLSNEDADRLMAGELDESTGRTDTIMVVHIPTFGGKPTMVSFPRDSWVNIPGYGENKINQAFSLGGPALLQQTIEERTGMRIDHYAEIGFGGFANVVDSVGGINMCLDEPLQDPMAGIDLQAGCQDMDGPAALGYVRSRYASANGDLDRVERQRQFLSALSTKLSSPTTIFNPFRSLPAIDALTSSLTVNDSDHVWHLAGLAFALARGAEQETVPISGPLETYAGSALQWDDAAADQLFESLK